MSSGQVKFGGKMDETTNYIEPTILVDVNPTDKIMQEEVVMWLDRSKEMDFVLHEISSCFCCGWLSEMIKYLA